MNEPPTNAWHGDWHARLETGLQRLGFATLEEFLAENPGAGTDLGSGGAFDHLMSSARGACSRPVDETVYLSVLFSRR
jgi:hypothetical protein